MGHLELPENFNFKVPTLLEDFAAWYSKFEYGSLGYFEIYLNLLSPHWFSPDSIRKEIDGFCFINLPDGSYLALLQFPEQGTNPVVLFGSEGESALVSKSLEEFLIDLSLGQIAGGLFRTGNDEADGMDEDAPAYVGGELKDWIAERTLEIPETKEFSLKDYLNGKSGF